MATARKGKPYIWVSWLSAVLGESQCQWAPWFKAHYQHDKYEPGASNLDAWTREHSELVASRRAALEAEGYVVTLEDQNAFRLEGDTAVLSGKPDIVAKRAGRVLVSDAKTGRAKDAGWWQVLTYLFALQRLRAAKGDRPSLLEATARMAASFEGELYYKTGDVQHLGEAVLPEKGPRIVAMIKVVGGDAPPPRVPSYNECRYCNIGPADCPDRIDTVTQVKVSDF